MQIAIRDVIHQKASTKTTTTIPMMIHSFQVIIRSRLPPQTSDTGTR